MKKPDCVGALSVNGSWDGRWKDLGETQVLNVRRHAGAEKFCDDTIVFAVGTEVNKIIN